MTPDVVDVLRNPVLHALQGPHARFAETSGDVRRYAPDVAGFAGLPDDPSPADWAALAELLGDDGDAYSILFVPDGFTRPAGWGVAREMECVQLALGADVDLPVAASFEFVQLGPDDVDEMLELVDRTEPGPFERRTVEMGLYLGARLDGVLVAMAGERLCLDGPDGPIVEISAVCTHPDHRGQGLGGALVTELVEIIRGGDGLPIMHVLRDNTVALSIYERLGFRIVRTFEALALTPPR